MPKNKHTALLRVIASDQTDVFHDMVRVSKHHRPFSSAGQVILVCCNGARIPLVARGAKANSRETISLDLRSREKFGLKPNTDASFEFREAGLWAEFVWAWNATDAMPRVAARLGLISVGLGTLGLVLGLASFIPR